LRDNSLVPPEYCGNLDEILILCDLKFAGVFQPSVYGKSQIS